MQAQAQARRTSQFCGWDKGALRVLCPVLALRSAHSSLECGAESSLSLLHISWAWEGRGTQRWSLGKYVRGTTLLLAGSA